jgi:hypothetical protein
MLDAVVFLRFDWPAPIISMMDLQSYPLQQCVLEIISLKAEQRSPSSS